MASELPNWKRHGYKSKADVVCWIVQDLINKGLTEPHFLMNGYGETFMPVIKKRVGVKKAK